MTDTQIERLLKFSDETIGQLSTVSHARTRRRRREEERGNKLCERERVLAHAQVTVMPLQGPPHVAFCGARPVLRPEVREPMGKNKFEGLGVASMFSFGQSLETWQGILATLMIPYRMSTPEAWRKGILDAKSSPGVKAQFLVTARRLFLYAELGRKKPVGRAKARTPDSFRSMGVWCD